MNNRRGRQRVTIPRHAKCVNSLQEYVSCRNFSSQLVGFLHVTMSPSARTHTYTNTRTTPSTHAHTNLCFLYLYIVNGMIGVGLSASKILSLCCCWCGAGTREPDDKIRTIVFSNVRLCIYRSRLLPSPFVAGNGWISVCFITNLSTIYAYTIYA